MKSLRKNACSSESRTIKKPTRRNDNRTFDFCKHPTGRFPTDEPNAALKADLAAAVAFGEAVLATAFALLERLEGAIGGDLATAAIRQQLNHAKTSMAGFRTRTHLQPRGVGV